MHSFAFPRAALSLACLLALSGGCHATHAAEAGVAFDLSRVVITAPAVGQLSTKSLLTSVDMVGADELQNAAVGGNWELLARLPGLQLTHFNQGTTSGKPSFRGFNGEGEVNAVKLLIDGVPANSNDGNMPYLDLITPLGLQAISVVRGTNDARYGLHNIAGNVELLSRQGGNATELRLGAGPWGKTDLQLALDREDGGFTQNLALGVRHADGWRAHAQSDRASANAQWGYSPAGQDLHISAALRAHHAEAQEPGYLTEADNATDPRQSYALSATDGGRRNVAQASLAVEGGQLSSLSWRSLVYVNRYEDQRWVRFSASASQQERDTQETHVGLRALLSWRPWQGQGTDLALEGGLDTEQQRNFSQRYSTTERSRVSQTRDQAWTMDVSGLFVQAVYKPLPTLKLVPGWRVDRIGGHFENRLAGTDAAINDFGSIQQPKFSVVWSPSESPSAYANWGRSFQIGVGSANYKIPPRTSDLSASINEGSELGLKFVAGPLLDGRIAVWQQTATDEVYRDLNSPSGDSTNIGATRRRGVDLQLRAHPARTLEAFATLALQQALIITPAPSAPSTQGKEVDHVPRQLFNAGLAWQAREDLQLSAWLQGQGSYWLERTNALTGKYGAYRTLNLSARWSISPTLQFEAQLLNAANGAREYVWWDGSQTLHSTGEPRSLNLSVRASF